MIIEGGVRKYGCAWMSSLARCRHRGRFASGRQGFVEMRTLPGVLPGEWRTPGTWEKKIIHYEIHRETLPALDQTNAEREERRWTSLFSTTATVVHPVLASQMCRYHSLESAYDVTRILYRVYRSVSQVSVSCSVIRPRPEPRPSPLEAIRTCDTPAP